MDIMKNYDDNYHGESDKSSLSNILKNADNELFHDEDNIPSIVLRAKRVKLPKKGENWQILENNKIVLLLKGTRFSKKEKTFLYSIEGMKFLVEQYKLGNKNVVKIKKAMKEVL
jgi:hypothetical protein